MLRARGADLQLERRPGSRRASRACGVTAQGLRPFSLGAPRRETCGVPPIRHGTAVTPSPPGKGASPLFVRALGRGSPAVAPLRVRVAHSAMVERGGDLLRRPTEVTPAPPAMRRCGELQLLGLDSCRGRLGLLGGQCPHPARDGVDSLRSCYARVGLTCNLRGGPARGGHGAGSSTLFIGRAAMRNLRGSPYPSRHSRDTFPSGEGGFAPFRSCARAGLPCGRPASREGCALRHG